MKLIELILHNWWFIVIAFFFLSGFFKRGKREAKPPGSRPSAPPSGMPPFGGGGTGPGMGWGRKAPGLNKGKSVPVSSERKGERQAPAAAADSRTAAKPKTEGASAPAFKGQSQSMEPQASFWDASPLEGDFFAGEARRTPFPGGGSPGQGRTKPLSGNQLAQGVIWAEILGPPRSKKPFRKL